MLPILAGESAFSKLGLTTLVVDTLRMWTLHYLTPCYGAREKMWFFNPYAEDTREVTLENLSDNYLTPTQERAIVEYCAFADYFAEDILLEGIQMYQRFDGKLSDLLRVADMFKYDRSFITRWWDEALVTERL